MRKRNVCFITKLLALAQLSVYTKTTDTSRIPIKHISNITIMSDAWIPIHYQGKGRNLANRGGGRGGRHAPAVAGRGPPPPGSPIASRISMEHNIPSSIDDLLDTFLHLSPTTHTKCTTGDLAHAKKVKVALKPRVLAPKPSRSQKCTHHNIHERHLARATLTLPQYIAKRITAPNTIKANVNFNIARLNYIQK